MVHDYSFFGSTADFVITNERLACRVFTGFGHLQTSETSGRNMIVELDSVIRSFQKLDGENEDLTLDLKKKNGNFYRYKCFQCWFKGENHEYKQNYNC